MQVQVIHAGVVLSVGFSAAYGNVDSFVLKLIVMIGRSADATEDNDMVVTSIPMVPDVSVMCKGIERTVVEKLCFRDHSWTKGYQSQEKTNARVDSNGVETKILKKS